MIQRSTKASGTDQFTDRPWRLYKVELYRAFQASGVRKAELARRMGIPKTNVDQLFDLKFKTSLTLMEAAFPAIGKRLEVAVHDRAA